MKQTVYMDDFRKAFMDIRPNSFSINGLYALYDYFTEYEESCGVEMELDVIAICCDYTEYGNLEELQKNYNDIESIEDLEENTTVIMIDDDSFIIQNY